WRDRSRAELRSGWRSVWTISGRACAWAATPSGASYFVQPRGSKIGHQAHEAFVLVVLMMTMEQRRPSIVGDEIDLELRLIDLFDVLAEMVPDLLQALLHFLSMVARIALGS